MRRFLVLSGLVAGGLGLFGPVVGATTWATTAASAACAPPQITVEPASGDTGSAITVRGKNFGKGCNDTVTPGQPSQPTPPDTDIRLYFDQGGKTWLIGTGNAQNDLTFEAHVFVPDGDGVNESPYGQTPKPGAATVRAKGTNGEPTAPFEVTKGTSSSTTSSTSSTSSTTSSTVKKSSTTLPDEGDLAATTTTAGGDDTGDDTDEEPSTTTTADEEFDTTEPTIALEDLSDDDATGDARTSPLTAVALVLVSAVAATTIVRARRF